MIRFLLAPAFLLLAIPPAQALDVADDDANEKYEVWISWVWDYPGSKRLPKSLSEGFADAFWDEVHGKADWKGPGSRTVGNGAALATHWEHGAVGGGEDAAIDQADLAVFIGHGKTTGFGNTFVTDLWFLDDTVYYKEGAANGVGKWGDTDLEWILAVACRAAENVHWIQSFGGLHLWAGSTENISQWAIPNGEQFGRSLAQFMFGEKPLSVWQSWAAVFEKNFSSRKKLRGLAANDKAIFKEHVWGKGTVHVADPAAYSSTNSKYLVFTHEGSTEGPPLSRRPPPARHVRAFPTDGGVLLMPARTDDWARSLPSTMPRLAVVPRVVDDAYAQDLAQRLCSSLGVLCAPEPPFTDDLGRRWLAEGSHVLVVSESGGFAYMDLDRWMAAPENAPAAVPSVDAAEAIAQSFLLGAQLLPDDALYDPGRSVRGVLSFEDLAPDDTTAVIDSTWTTHVGIGFGREVVTPPFGPFRVEQQGSFRVHVGEGEQITAVFHNGWRDVIPAGQESIIDLAEATSRLLDGDTIGQWCGCDTVAVDSAYVGYVEADADTPQDFLLPVYLFDVQCNGEAIEDDVLIVPALPVDPLPAPEAHAAYGPALAIEPNPVRTDAVIRYGLPRAGALKLSVYGVDGRLVATLEEKDAPRGSGETRWDGRDRKGRAVAAGTYFVRLEHAAGATTRKIVVIR